MRQATPPRAVDGMRPLTAGERALCERLLGPEGACLLLSGSYARGWEHSHSDVDVIVIGIPPLRAAEQSGAEIGPVPHRICYLDGKQWEVEYYSTQFVEQLIATIGIAAEAADCGADPMRVIGSYELGRALRLHGGVALHGESQARAVQERMRAAGLARLVTRIAVDSCDAALDDALGLLAGGDLHAAVLAASSAVGYAVDAFLASRGELWPGVKWRYRKYLAMLERQPEAGLTLDADTCWRLLTLADFDPEKSERWVCHAVARCQNLLFDLMEIDKLTWTNQPRAVPLGAPPFLDPEDEVLARTATTAGAMALVVSPDGLVLHLRDDKPWIPHPGCWSLFGGAVEEGEEPAQAVVRELQEELGLDGAEYRPLWRVVDAGGDGRVLTIFEARTALGPEEMTLTEGQALRAFDRASALQLKLAPFCRRILERYPEARSC